ncbi:GNAT family N-acetyltransferase [Fodinicurvata fenggangensis]|uniref:GNAT family N-acetyltransferase n=1 Tax=Fodinicurvata fenggangensis TaxID=1121830 RepID=UPI00138DEB7E|nr:GNAT family N-acetyltransferase [Fodinicurvata fenggangensis]
MAHEPMEADAGVVRFSELQEADLHQARQLSAAEGWPHREEDWRFMLQLGEGLAAFDGEKLIGTAMAWPFGEAVSTVGMVLVHPRRRGSGMGKALFKRLMDRIAAPSIQLHATEQAAPLYRAFEFMPVGQVRQCQGEAPSQGFALSEDRTGVRVLKPSALDEILALDARATGADRSDLLTGIARMGRCYGLPDESGLHGYAISRPFGRGIQVGPVVADSDAGAVALAAACLSEVPGGCHVRFDVPVDSPLADWVQRQGLPAVGLVTRMQRGPDPRQDNGSAMTVHGLASQALG